MLLLLLAGCGDVMAAPRPDIEDLVFVFEATALGARGDGTPGCAAMSVVSIGDGAAVHLGQPVLSTTRIVANPDFTMAMAGQAAGALGRFYVLNELDQSASRAGLTGQSGSWTTICCNMVEASSLAMANHS